MTDTDPGAASNAGPLAVICGGGSLPYVVARAAQQQGRRVVLFPLRGSADSQAVAPFDHHWIVAGKFGQFRKLARSEGCCDVVMIGSVLRPALRDLRFDFAMLRVLPRLIRTFRSGDNSLLSGIAQMFQEHGLRVVGAHEIAPEILMPPGPLAGRQPTDSERADIALALALLRATGPFDVGQAAIVADQRVLALEAAEGTDRMLARFAELRQSGQVRVRPGSGVLVKAPKPAQDRRLDLPSIGPRTVEGAAKAGLAGIAVMAGSTIVAEPEGIVAAADRASLFVVGVPADETGK